MDWSPQQESALRAVDNWYKSERHDKQVFRLFGFAGTGKTTLAKHFAQNIQGTVKFATFTGKAAHVMAKKGCVGASTIHKLIYIPQSMSRARLLRLMEERQKLTVLLNMPDISQAPSGTTLPTSKHIRDLDREIAKEKENAGRMNFAINEESELPEASLLIIDECSMVDAPMGRDLESFGVPILVLGDPEQLPPIHGAGHFTEKPHDILLTEIHRQARDNPIIEMSRIVREGGALPLGNYGTSRVVDSRLSPEDVQGHDITLVGLRRTKKACDDRFRALLGHSDPMPRGGERVMCVRNNHDLGLLNGQMWTMVDDSSVVDDEDVFIHVREEDSGTELAVKAAQCLFRGEKLERWDHRDGIQEFEYGYTITVHKSQGSQWGSVLLIDQKGKFPNFSARDQRRWLYTGITRAADRVTVMRL